MIGCPAIDVGEGGIGLSSEAIGGDAVKGALGVFMTGISTANQGIYMKQFSKYIVNYIDFIFRAIIVHTWAVLVEWPTLTGNNAVAMFRHTIVCAICILLQPSSYLKRGGVRVQQIEVR